MRIKWIGHSCFLIEGKDVKVITDPYGEGVPYRTPDYSVDVVTVSHEHFDHNAVERVKGDPLVIRGAGSHEGAGIRFTGIGTFHDEDGGGKRGLNTIFTFTIDGVSLAHLGDLGHPLSGAQAEALSGVDLLFIPVGGHFTIGANEARDLIGSLPSLKVAIPMHYKTDRLGEDFPIATVDNFIRKMENVRKIGRSEVSLVEVSLVEVSLIDEDLPNRPEVWILDYA